MVHAQRESDSLENPISIAQGFVIPEAKHAIALSFEIRCAGFIGSPLQRVVTAVQLDDQLGFRTAEVRDERANGVLATEV
jgi:hypothetical protein